MVLYVISLNCMLLIVLYFIRVQYVSCNFIVLYGIAWYCIVFVFFARYRTVMYRCNSAPANYRVVHLVILVVFFCLFAITRGFLQKGIIEVYSSLCVFLFVYLCICILAYLYIPIFL